MIELKDVSKRFGSETALHPTTLNIPAGKSTALIGPSGCGKSTLLRLIMGILSPTQGSVTVGGKVVSPENILEIRRKMGYVIQDGGLFPHLTARQNVLLMPDHLKNDTSKSTSRLNELCELTRFPKEALDRYSLG